MTARDKGLFRVCTYQTYVFARAEFIIDMIHLLSSGRGGGGCVGMSSSVKGQEIVNYSFNLFVITQRLININFWKQIDLFLCFLTTKNKEQYKGVMIQWVPVKKYYGAINEDEVNTIQKTTVQRSVPSQLSSMERIILDKM